MCNVSSPAEPALLALQCKASLRCSQSTNEGSVEEDERRSSGGHVQHALLQILSRIWILEGNASSALNPHQQIDRKSFELELSRFQDAEGQPASNHWRTLMKGGRRLLTVPLVRQYMK